MPICIECRQYVQTLYTTYSKADDKALGKGVRLTQCPRCKRFADKYVEHDMVVLFIDLVLIKPQVYRHLLFNLLGREDGKFDPSVLRLGTLLLLFDVYLTWARIEKATPSSPPPGLPSPPVPLPTDVLKSGNLTIGPWDPLQNDPNTLAHQPILLQYLFFLFLCTLETLSFHLPIRLLLSYPLHTLPPLTLLPGKVTAWIQRNNPIPHYPHPALISTALLVSSFTKLFPLLLLVWQYDLPSSASAVSWAVIINNVAALEILLDCGFGKAAGLAGVGAVWRAGVGWFILRAVGVGGGVAAAGVVETEDLIEVWRRLSGSLGFG